MLNGTGMKATENERWTGERIRALRLERGWTQEDLAQRIGVRAGTVCRWERGRNRPVRCLHWILDELAAEGATKGGTA
jgi:DNA-binding transcriptional regulator YiaG